MKTSIINFLNLFTLCLLINCSGGVVKPTIYENLQAPVEPTTFTKSENLVEVRVESTSKYSKALRPQSLTKTQLKQDADELVQLITDLRQSENRLLIKYKTQKGDTLQSISKRLYHTTRLWTELYLLNHLQLTNFDLIEPDLTLNYYK